MKIAIASGKGGTGKTTIATNFAVCLAQTGKKVSYVDCDVEEPNGHIFLRPRIEKTEQAVVAVPEVDLQKCIGCGKCGAICQYSAIVSLKGTVLTFEQLCHSCGGCALVCPEKAITEKEKIIGTVEQGYSDKVGFIQGRLEIGDVRSPALIKRVKQRIDSEEITIIDAPPGTTCPVIEAVKEVDYILLVTEPTPFGLNDLKLAVEMVRQLKVPFSVVINRDSIGDDRVEKYCDEENIEIKMKLPNDRRVAETYSSGNMVVETLPEYKETFEKLAAAFEV